jgi:hypothetical protein
LTFHGPRTEEAGPRVDPAGAPVEDAGPDPAHDESAPAQGGRLLDRGAITAAFVGFGISITIAISFGLVIAIQPLVFVAAPLAGVTIGYYANYKSARWRPRWRLFANAGFAALVTGISLAVFYIALRLLFIYADSGYRPETMGGPLDCANGPACTYQRLIEDDARRTALADDGVTDVASYTGFVWRTSAEWSLQLTAFTVIGALVPAAWRAWKPAPTTD